MSPPTCGTDVASEAQRGQYTHLWSHSELKSRSRAYVIQAGKFLPDGVCGQGCQAADGRGERGRLGEGSDLGGRGHTLYIPSPLAARHLMGSPNCRIAWSCCFQRALWFLGCLFRKLA